MLLINIHFFVIVFHLRCFASFINSPPQPASVLFQQNVSANQTISRHRRVMRKEPQWSMVSVVPSYLHSASLQLKQNYSFCPEDLSIDTVTYPLRYRGTFATMIQRN